MNSGVDSPIRVDFGCFVMIIVPNHYCCVILMIDGPFDALMQIDGD